MSNNQKIDWNEKLFDAMLGVAIEEAVLQEMDALPSREELDAMYPATTAFDKKIKSIIAKEERDYKRKQMQKTLIKIVACIGIFIIIGTVVLMSVDASRIYILNAIISMQEDHLAFDFVYNEHSQLIEADILIDGFEYIGSQTYDNMLTISMYVNADGRNITIQRHEGANLRAAIDTDYREYSTIRINYHEIFLFEAEGNAENNVLMWEQRNAVIQIISNADIETIIVTAEALIK